MITRPGLAMCWPDTALPHIGQPLGGELLFTRAVAQVLHDDPGVQAQSDWGIDTRFTIATTAAGFGTVETYVPQGKIHKLYGSLTDIKDMAIECFTALQSARKIAVGSETLHDMEPVDSVSEAVKRKTAYSVGDTVGLLRDGWTDRQLQLLDLFDPEISRCMTASRDYPRLGFFDADLWGSAYNVLLESFDSLDRDWRELLFRLWAARVLSYTVTEAVRGYDAAIEYLQGTIDTYRIEASTA
jgi:mannosylglycerate synthase